MADRLTVTVNEDGPYKVSGARSIRYCGKPVEFEGDVWLCRCGQSSNAPFCDGTHRKVGFEGTSPESETKKEVRVWEGRRLRTRFNPNTCMHAFKCQPLKALREAELAGDDAASEEIARVVAACPSGALSYEAKDTIAEADYGCDVDVDVIEGGEIRVQVDHDINATRFEGQREDRSTLCRCGLSASKPWCDGRHKGRKDFR